MAPELVLIKNGIGTGIFDPEKCDVFSLGMSFLRIALRLEESKISGLNTEKK